MEIIDLTPEYHQTYFNCLEDWSEEIKEAGNHKACWYGTFKDRGLRVKLALDEQRRAVGMIQYLPVEESFVDGDGLYLILCIWVHGHKQGLGNQQGKGYGAALLAAAEADARALGAKGVAAWGLWLPIWMKASWYRKHGYRKADRVGLQLLVWKPFCDDAHAPRWRRARSPEARIPDKVTVTAFKNGWCTAQNMVFERTRKACAQFDDQVEFQTIDTSDRDTLVRWGIADAIFVDGKSISWGPPLTQAKIVKILANRVKKLNR